MKVSRATAIDIETNLREYTGESSHFGHDVGDVSVDEHDEWLEYGCSLGELGHENSHETEDETDCDTTDGHHEEGNEAEKEIQRHEIALTDGEKTLEHSIEDLSKGRRSCYISCPTVRLTIETASFRRDSPKTTM
jgi:hypothetical protein